MVQPYVDITNMISLPMPFLIYENENVIGFIQINYYSNQDMWYSIEKIIIGKEFQQKGYGTRAIKHAVGYIETLPCGWADYITLHCHKNNHNAKKVFGNNGFYRTENIHDIEIYKYEILDSRETYDFEKELPDYKCLDQLIEYMQETNKWPEILIGDNENVHFERITLEACSKIKNMQLFSYQEEFVMPFVDTLADVYRDLFRKDIASVCYAISDGGKVIGLIEILYDKTKLKKDKYSYDLYRILIDKQYQKQGYGRKAIELFLSYVKTNPLGEADLITTAVVEGNDLAKKLYESYGFKEMGRYEGEDKENYIYMELS